MRSTGQAGAAEREDFAPAFLRSLEFLAFPAIDVAAYVPLIVALNNGFSRRVPQMRTAD